MVGPLAHRLPGLPPSAPALEDGIVRALCVLAIAWIVAWLCAPHVPAAVVWAGTCAAHAVLLLGPPLPLTDVFNYLQYGRIPAAHGLNPYVVVPAAAAHDAAYEFSNWHHLRSPYGPLFTLLTEGLAPLPLPTAYWVYKGLVFATSIGTLVVVAGTARQLGCSGRAAVVLVGLNPLVLFYGLGGAHNEPLLLLPLMGAVALAVASRRWVAGWADAGAGACAALAAGIKPSAVVLVPLVILGCRRRIPASIGAAAVAAVVLGLVATHYGGHLPATGVQERLVTPLSIPNLLAVLAGQGGLTAGHLLFIHAVLAAVVVAAVLAVARRPAWLPAAAGLVMLAVVLTLGWAMPWYVWWVLPFAALLRTRALAVACVVVTAWLALGAVPQMPSLLHEVGYYPTRTAVGHASHEYMERHLR
jgi:hypothetical protein